MGGMGSGGHNWRHRGTVEGYRRIDAGLLHTKGMLEDGVSGTVIWTTESGEKNFIHVFGGRSIIRLSYRSRSNGGPWTDVNETVRLDWAKRHFGGAQAYFLCPKCASRRRHLIGASACLVTGGPKRPHLSQELEGEAEGWSRSGPWRTSRHAAPGHAQDDPCAAAC